MIKDRAAFDLPAYTGLLAGHYSRGKGYERKRLGGTDDWLLVMTLAGEGRFGSRNGDIPAVPPSLHLIAPGTTHDYGTAPGSQEWELIWVHFFPAQTWLDLLHWEEAAPGHFCLVPLEPDITENTFRQVLNHFKSSKPLRLQFAMNALEHLLLICASQNKTGGLPLDARIQSVIDHISSNPTTHHSAKDLSDIAGLSVSRFSHLFKTEIGIAPHQYVMQRKLQHVCHLLDRTSLSISEAASVIGMDPAELSQRFKQHFGVTPRDFRKRNKLS